MADKATQRTAVVTGAAARNGIGFHTASRFIQEGWAVVLADIDGAAATAAAEELEKEFGGTALAFGVDVRDEQAVNAMAQNVSESNLPEVTALANIAGVPSTTSFLDVSLDLWNRIIDINLTGTFLLCKAFLPQMIESGQGSIVNMSSVSAQQGGGIFSKTPYSAAKAGVLGLTRSLAREMGPHGITVNAVAPGVVETSIREAETNPELEQTLTASIPLGRQALPSEIAALTTWLCSSDARFITGATHSINGGGYIS